MAMYLLAVVHGPSKRHHSTGTMAAFTIQNTRRQPFVTCLLKYLVVGNLTVVLAQGLELGQLEAAVGDGVEARPAAELLELGVRDDYLLARQLPRVHEPHLPGEERRKRGKERRKRGNEAR